MAIKVRCANASCGREFSLKDELAGKRVKCPNCGSVIAVPAAEEEEIYGVSEEPQRMVPFADQPPSTPPAAQKNHGLAVTSLVLGIIAIPTGCVVVGALLGLVGIILGIAGIAKVSNAPERFKGKGLAVGGIITGGLGIAVSIIVIFIILFIRDVTGSPEVKATTDLARIGGGLQQHKTQNGALPQSLDELPAEMFQAVPPLIGAVDLNAYEYRGAELTQEELNDPRTVLVYAKQPLETGEHAVLLVDGTPLIISDEDFTAALAGKRVPLQSGRPPMLPSEMTPPETPEPTPVEPVEVE
jgi:hypothetical protein